MTSFLVVVLYPGKPSQLAAGLYLHIAYDNCKFSIVIFFSTAMLLVMLTLIFSNFHAGLIITLIFMVLILAFRPLASDGLNSTQSGALLSNLLTLFVGIMLIVTANLEDAAKRAGEGFDSTERDIISSLIFIANMLVMAIPAFKFLSDVRVFEKATAAISGWFGNDDENKEIEAMINIRNDRQQLAAQGTEPLVSNCKGRGSTAPPPTPPGAELADSAAPVFLHGDIVVAHGYYADALNLQTQLAMDNSRVWA